MGREKVISKLKKVVTIINPAAGNDSPVLSLLNTATHENSITNEVLVTQKPSDVAKFARRALKLKPDAVVVYGGDGTVVSVAKALYTYKSKVPLILLPGGTANVIAKELLIPNDLAEALKIFGRKPKVVELNTAAFGKEFMLLRIEVGILAKMVQQTKSEAKSSLGIIAYPITALKEAMNATPMKYTLTLDGKKRVVEGVGLMIANVGNIGIPGVSLQTKVSSNDGLLDVFVLTSSGLSTLVAVSSSALIGTPKPLTLKHWQVKKVSVSFMPKQVIIKDDLPVMAARFTVSMNSEKVTILV
ncbi:MAG: hypothetical protein M3Q81_04670 [bacterium]|nr:hypothetical protein [bacterium]